MNGRHTILALALWSGASAIATATAQEAEGGNPVVRAYAQQTGISVTEAKRRLSREAEIVAMQRKLESEDDFAALKVVHSPEFKAVVLAKGDAPGLLRKHTTNPLFVGRQVPRGRKELEGARAASLRVLENLKAEFETDIDPEAGEVKILVTDASAARPALAAVIRNFPFVTITQVPDIARPVATFRGGQEILTSTDKCTTGFAVKNSANLQGFITAGHCTGPLTVQGITFSNPQAPAQYTGNHDQQWFARSGHIYSPTIFTGDTSTSTMTIKGIANPPLGWPLCKFGRTTRQKGRRMGPSFAVLTRTLRVASAPTAHASSTGRRPR